VIVNKSHFTWWGMRDSVPGPLRQIPNKYPGIMANLVTVILKDPVSGIMVGAYQQSDMLFNRHYGMREWAVIPGLMPLRSISKRTEIFTVHRESSAVSGGHRNVNCKNLLEIRFGVSP